MTLKPSARIPLELKAHIFRFCDPSTLAQTSRVSLAFLELSSPLLYRDIIIEDAKTLNLLLSLTVEQDQHQPHLDAYTSLSLISTLTLIPWEAVFINSRDLDDGLSLHRLRRSLPSGRLPLDTLEIVLLSLNEDHYVPYFQYLDPLFFHLRAGGRTGGTVDVDHLVWIDFVGLEGWDRLERMLFVSAYSVRSLLVSGSEKRSQSARDRGVEVVYDLTRVAGGIEDGRGDLDVLVNDLLPFGLGLEDLSLYKEVPIMVRSSYERSYVLDALKDSPFLRRIEVQVRYEPSATA